MEKNKKSTLIETLNIDEIILLNNDGLKGFDGLIEKYVKIRVFELDVIPDKKTVKQYRVIKDNIEIADIDNNGNVKFSDKYIQELKLRQPEFFKRLGLENVEKYRVIKPLDIEKKLEKAREDELLISEKEEKIIGYKNTISINKDNSEQINKEVNKDKNKNKENEKPEKRKTISKKEQKVQQIEDELGINIEACTEIRDTRFYETVPDARNYSGFVRIVYSKDNNEFLVVGKDANGKIEKIKTIKESRQTTRKNYEIDDNKIQEKPIGNILEVRGNVDDSYAYSVKYNPMAAEIEVNELRYDKESGEYIAAQLYTTMQRPAKNIDNIMKKQSNKEISDELEVIREYKKEYDIDVIEIEEISKEAEVYYKILTPREIERELGKYNEKVSKKVKQNLRDIDNKDITLEILREEAEKVEEELQYYNDEKTIGNDAATERRFR